MNNVQIMVKQPSSSKYMKHAFPKRIYAYLRLDVIGIVFEISFKKILLKGGGKKVIVPYINIENIIPKGNYSKS